MILSHGRQLLMFLPIEELYTRYNTHERLQVFAEYGLDCVTCPRKGTFLIVSKETAQCRDSRKRKSVNRIHLDIYTDDFTLMTVDHKVPKAVAKELGWTTEEIEALSNKQPMCDPCNNGKGCKPITNDQLQENRSRAFSGLRRPTSVTGLLVPNIHALLGDNL